ncbi:hypothetical protein [Sphingopyxis sp. MWB1]|uniref:hypothetical protein n=1 Tax=Sphingopyxis sp. MWB1 TaxID=1537715 RepID=UPI00051A4946|nr:hypothetical protein [Sphingopyxis sp. MWB1]
MVTESVKTPAHLWAIGGLSLVWNALGGYDYLMTKLKNPAHMAAFTDEQRAYFDHFPIWADFGWGLGVWMAILGSILLLARSRYAVGVFLLSILGLAISSIYQFGLHYGDLMRMFGTFPIIFSAILWVVAIALYVYARAQAAKGVLR